MRCWALRQRGRADLDVVQRPVRRGGWVVLCGGVNEFAWHRVHRRLLLQRGGPGAAGGVQWRSGPVLSSRLKFERWSALRCRFFLHWWQCGADTVRVVRAGVLLRCRRHGRYWCHVHNRGLLRGHERACGAVRRRGVLVPGGGILANRVRLRRWVLRHGGGCELVLIIELRGPLQCHSLKLLPGRCRRAQWESVPYWQVRASVGRLCCAVMCVCVCMCVCVSCSSLFMHVSWLFVLCPCLCVRFVFPAFCAFPVSGVCL
jgi:hypothetical protein